MSKSNLLIWKWSLLVFSYFCLFLPLCIMLMINYDKYFIHKDGMTVALGGILALVYVLLLVKIGFKKINKTLNISIFLAIVYCLDSILADAVPLTLALFVGVVLFDLLSIPTNYFKKRLEAYTDEEVRTTARARTNAKLDYDRGGRI